MLSRKAKYAIKALLYIYDHQDKIPISVKEISEAKKIPYKFLESIMNSLKQNWIIRSHRAPKGGYSFAIEPSEITVASIVRMMDGPIAFTTCTSENFYEKCEECIDEDTCKVRRIFLDLRTQMIPVLERSITDL